jgi:hypothetical protein
MSDKSKLGQPSPEPVKRERKSIGQRMLQKTAPGRHGSHPQPNKSSPNDSLSKAEPASLQTAQKKNEGIVEVDGPAKSISFKRKRIFGTNNEDVTRALAQQVLNFIPTVAGKLDSRNSKWALTTLSEIGPKDELERLLAVQMIGVHRLAAECLMRASREGQTPYGIDANINRATKLLRTFTAQMDALNRHRGKVSQQVLVGNVNVNEGGQAIVGSVSRDGREKASTKDDTNKVE